METVYEKIAVWSCIIAMGIMGGFILASWFTG